MSDKKAEAPAVAPAPAPAPVAATKPAAAKAPENGTPAAAAAAKAPENGKVTVAKATENGKLTQKPAPPEQMNGKLKKRPSLSARLSSAARAIQRSFSPVPKYPYQPTATPTEAPTGLLDDVKKLGFEDVDTLADFLNAAVKGEQDDADLLLERLIQLMAKLPHTSIEGKKLESGLIHDLWESLEHPPVTSLGDKYRYREADGSYNNIRQPELGAARTPYARTTPPMTFQNPNLPEASVVFDTLMARGDSWNPHPNRISSVLFYLATIIIHDIFQTDGEDKNMNNTSSYLDLSPLYGRNQEEQDQMRTFSKGLLKPDCFSSKRILGFPPGVGVFLIMFNRFHNYVATQLAHINEGGRFTPPKEGVADYDAKLKKYDNDLFQTARLVTGGLYVNIILRDYVRTILNLNRSPSSWALDPRAKDGRDILAKPTAVATGNQVSAEFNLIYRWHSSVSQRDEKWTIDEFRKILKKKDPSLPDDVDPAKVPMHTVLVALHDFEKDLSDDPLQRPFAGLERQANKTLPDDALAQMWVDSVEDVAGSFGANRVPDVLKSVEILGIMQARYWNLATLNEFRAYFGLTKYKTFEDINPDPEVAKKLQQLYDSPDSVELYPGLVAEKAKPPMAPGSGLCVNYTTSRAILSDAVALVRGDRFYTIDYTPKNLTNWGYNEANYDISVDQSHLIYKLVFRAFPNHFVGNSVYAHFPMVIPSENKIILEKLDKADLYSWAKPARKPDLVVVRSHKAVTEILLNQQDFKVTWGPAIRFLVDQPGKASYGAGFCLSGDDAVHTANRALVRKALYPTAWEKEVWKFYAATVPKLFKKYSYPVAGTPFREVDITRDVINLTNARFNAALFCLPIKTEETPRGIYTEQELYMVLTVLFSSIFFDGDIASSHKLRTAARELAQQLGALVTLNCEAVAKVGFIADAVAKLREGDAGPALPNFGNHLIERLLAKGKSVPEVVWGTIMPVITANVTNQSQLLTQCLDYYLGDGKEHLPELYKLAQLNTPEADETLMRYMLEGCRLRGIVAVYRDLTTEQTITDHAPAVPDPVRPFYNQPLTNPNIEATKRTFTVPAGHRVVLDLVTAGRDPEVFPDPETVKLDRPLEAYTHFGHGPHLCAGIELSRVAQTGLFKAIVGKKNLQRAPGERGQLKSLPVRRWQGQVGEGHVDEATLVWTGLRVYMTPDQSGMWPVPSTLKVRWEE